MKFNQKWRTHELNIGESHERKWPYDVKFTLNEVFFLNTAHSYAHVCRMKLFYCHLLL